MLTCRKAARAPAGAEPVSNDNATVSFLAPDDVDLVQGAARLAFCNPFAAERLEAERAALGGDFVDVAPVWGRPVVRSENARRIAARLGPAIGRARARLAAGAAASDADLAVYQDACFWLLYDACAERLQAIAERRGPSDLPAVLHDEIAGEHERLLGLPALFGRVCRLSPEHVFSCFLQMRRAYHFISTSLLGSSRPAAELRADVWRSIFTDDLRSYVYQLYERLVDVPTLITGPTGTGKELAARAIGLSPYVPFAAEAQRLAADPEAGYHPLNLAVMSASLLESELFGHARGAFTGAVDERRGWLDCGPGETVFLDEIGELDPAIQIKLLRVLQTRVFQPVGGREDHRFSGRLVAATHRDLEARIQEGAFREDFFYRICSDWIVTPSLRRQLDDTPGDLGLLVQLIADKVAGPAQGEALAKKTVRWIEANLPAGYAWPGNVRELEGYVRSMMMRGRCRPVRACRAHAAAPARPQDDDAFRKLLEGRLSLDEVERLYITLVYAETKNYKETARRVGIGRHLVPAKIDRALLARLARLEKR